MSEPDRQLPVEFGTVLLNKYRVDRIIGIGGMGTVAQAWHVDFDERVAIKFLRPEMVESAEAVGRFEREARVLFKIKSVNVARVIDVGTLSTATTAEGATVEGVPFMVMEFLEGRDLATLLQHREPMPMDRAVDYGLQACQALAHAHVRGIVHRDLKPENLFAAKDPTGDVVIKLLDFGLSKDDSETDGQRSRQLTTDEQVMGTPHYMSPEQWMSSSGVGQAADQWALAAIVFEMLTGRPPFEGTTLAHVCAAIMHDATPSIRDRIPNLPRGLDAVLAKALEKNPLHRYENVGAFAVALAAFAKPGAAARAELTLEMLLSTSTREADRSGEMRAMPSPAVSPDRAATVRKPPPFAMPQPPASSEAMPPTVAPRLEAKRIRSTTSTSWQQMEQRRDSKKLALVAVFVSAILLLFGGGAVYLLGQPTAGTQQSETEDRGPKFAGRAPPAAEAPSTSASATSLGSAAAAKSASGRAAPSASVPSAPSVMAPRPTPSYFPVAPRPRLPPPKPKESIFDQR